MANMALLLNMARRLSFAIAQSLTIVGWFMSSFLLIGLVGAANTSAFRLLPHESHALTQAFYYAIIAAGIYCIISILMIATVYGAYRGHYEKEFRLTMSQRTLMLQTIGFMMYLLLGACIFKYIEGWEFLDAVYWADFTLLTIGVGDDFTPKTHLGRSLLFPFAIGGIVTVGLVIGSIRSLVLERGKKKMEARFTEKRRQKIISRLDDKRTIRSGFHTVSAPWYFVLKPQPNSRNSTSSVRKDSQNRNDESKNLISCEKSSLERQNVESGWPLVFLPQRH
jgi:potassium channel subfamily K